MTQLWKGETDKAIESFLISGERVPVEVVRMRSPGREAEAARVNAELGLLDPGQAAGIAAAAEAVAAGEHEPDQFLIDVFQTGSKYQHQHQRQGRGHATGRATTPTTT